MKIMTVCTGNICRSPLGEYLLTAAAQDAQLDLTVASSGISNEEAGNPIDHRTKRILDSLGINSDTHRAKQFKAADFATYDLLLAMDTNHYHRLKQLAPTEEAAQKVHLMREFDPAMAGKPTDELGIYDPWYGSFDDFTATYQMIADAVPGVIDYARRASTT